MKKTFITTAVLVLALIACNETKTRDTPATDTATAAAATLAPAAEEPMPDSATMAKAWEAYMTPGDMHKWMATADGKWEAELTFWMGPGAEPTPPSKASVQNKMILGGRYQESIYKGDMMGMAFEGHGILGYDNAKKKFINTWIDNTGTGVMYMEGPWDEDSKSMTLTGTMVDPVSGKEKNIRQVFKTVDDSHQVMEMYDTRGGEEYKSMEIKLTKK